MTGGSQPGAGPDRPPRLASHSCDNGGPIDSTLRASTIADPYYGYDPITGHEVPAGTKGSITVMAVDNLPCELPRDASDAFGQDLVARVMPFLIGPDSEGMIARATIARAGSLTDRFAYLADYAASPPSA